METSPPVLDVFGAGVASSGWEEICAFLCWFLRLTMQHPPIMDLMCFANEAWFNSWIHYFKEHNVSEP
jgi:hypothetical protein